MHGGQKQKTNAKEVEVSQNNGNIEWHEAMRKRMQKKRKHDDDQKYPASVALLILLMISVSATITVLSWECLKFQG